MRFATVSLFMIAACQAFSSPLGQFDGPSSAKTMVLTFDDLPYAAGDGARDTIQNAQRVTDSILAILDEYQAPAAVFVNEAKLHVGAEFDERRGLLQQWVDAGATLGNHTFSHMDLNTATILEFKRDIIRGETVIRSLMEPHKPYQLYFRHPYTHTGDSKAKKAEIDSFLVGRGYKVAPYTVDSQDYVFNAAYLLGKRQGNNDSAMRACAAYSDFVVGATEFAENVSVQIFGGNITQTLLLHANDINAECLGKLLAQFERSGYEFISLAEASADPAYQTKDTLVTAYGPSWLWRWMKSKDMKVSFERDPEPPEWVVASYERAMQAAGESL